MEPADNCDEKCSLCNPESKIPHVFRTTMVKVANLCCIQEDLLIRSTLAGMKGVESVDVNVVGKYAIIKPCATPCCAPTSLLLQKLNDKRLGVSIRDVINNVEAVVEPTTIYNCYDRFFDTDVVKCAIVTFFFLVGLIIKFAAHENKISTGLFIV